MVFWSFSSSSAFWAWVSMPSFVADSGLIRRAWFSASQSSLSFLQSSSSRVLTSGLGFPFCSFFVSVVSFSFPFLLKNPSSGMGVLYV